MQSDIKTIYKLTAERTKKKEQVYSDIGNFIQKEIKDNLKKPKKLILKVKGLGTWYLRKKKMTDVLRMYPPYYEIEGYNEFESENALRNFENKQELYFILKARLLDYQDFLDKKNLIKKIRNEFVEVPKDKKDGRESSQD